MDSLLIMLVIFAITGISGWLQRKAQAAEEAQPAGKKPQHPRPGAQPDRALVPPQTPPANTPESKAPADLETQLRRWLQKEFSPEDSPPVLSSERATTPPHASISQAKQVAPAQSSVTKHAEALKTHLEKSTHVPEHAENLYKETLSHLRNRRITGGTHQTMVETEDDESSREIVDAVSMLQDPTTVRQALVASFILAPPKALEESQSI